MATVVIERRFRGPEGSANGGYAAGLAAAALGGGRDGPVAVRLHAAPPLGTPLSIASDGESAEMSDGAVLVATATRAASEPAPFEPVGLDDARRASRPLDPDRHPFPHCFVCGPLRGPGDGLCVYPGRVAGSDRFAAIWTPDPSLGGGEVRTEFVWAALDCPTGVPFLLLDPDGPPCVLGTLTARIHGGVRVGEPHVLTSRIAGAEGRRRYADVVLSDAGGAVRAAGAAVWVVLAG